MMATRKDKVRAYYQTFDEWRRLDTAEGMIEFSRTMDTIKQYLPPESRVLDLGGGPGRYALELARVGHRVVLADISPELLDTARNLVAEHGVETGVESIDEVDAEDLGRYSDGAFDAVLALGPFYHLVMAEERQRAAVEIRRVLRPDGLLFVAFIPRASGIAGLIERAAEKPSQVSFEVFRAAAETGIFRNASGSGFQEGYYPAPGELEGMLESVGFGIVDELSLRSVAFGIEPQVASLEPLLRREVERLMADMSRQPEIVATSGHVLIVARAG